MDLRMGLHLGTVGRYFSPFSVLHTLWSKEKPLKTNVFKGFIVELMMGLEPMTSSLPRMCSTA